MENKRRFSIVFFHSYLDGKAHFLMENRMLDGFILIVHLLYIVLLWTLMETLTATTMETKTGTLTETLVAMVTETNSQTDWSWQRRRPNEKNYSRRSCHRSYCWITILCFCFCASPHQTWSSPLRLHQFCFCAFFSDHNFKSRQKEKEKRRIITISNLIFTSSFFK